MKKKFAVSLIIASLLSPSIAFASTNETQNQLTLQEERDATTAYKYWNITSSTRTGSRTVGSEQYYSSTDIQNNGNSYFVGYSKSQKGSASVNITVGGSLISASIGYTPGTTVVVTDGVTSGAYKKGTTVTAYATQREDIYKIEQAEYEVNNFQNIHRPTGRTQTGTVYKPTSPNIRFSPNPNY